MKLKILLAMLAGTLIACDKEENPGLCYGYDESNERVACVPQISELECLRHDEIKKDGLNWEYEKGGNVESICPPREPSR